MCVSVGEGVGCIPIVPPKKFLPTRIFFPNHEIPIRGGASLPMTPSSQYFHLLKVNLGTIIFAARKSGGAEPSMMLDP